MAEQYTEIINLFDIETVVQVPFTSGANDDLKLNLIRFLDGQIRVDGQFFVPTAAAVGDLAVLCDFNNFSDSMLSKFLSADFYDSFLMMSTVAASGGFSAQLGTVMYIPAQRQMVYHYSALAQDVVENVVWTLQGVLVPKSITPTSSLLWSK